MLSGGGKTISYTAFNKPDQIQGTSATVDLIYGPSRSILKQVTTTSEKTTSKISLGGYEYLDIQKSGQTTIKERFRITGDVVVSFENGDATSPTEEHLFMDGMGSVVAVAHGLGGVTERYRYDPWGRPRKDVDWTAMSDRAWFGMERAEKATSKGYTGHEMLDDVGIIHMGGRIYDPTIGRFLSADPVIKGLDQVESYNRYSYALNNPMSITDPSGYSWLSKTWKKLRNSIKKRMGIVLAVFNPQMAIAEVTSRYAGKEMARFAARNKYAGEVFGIVGMAGCAVATGGGGAAGCLSAYQAWTAGAVSYGSGESIEKALLAGARSAALAYADAGVVGAIGDWQLGWAGSGIAHGARGAAFARMRGADVRSGVIGGMTEGMIGNRIKGWTDGERGSGSVLAGLVSGAVSEATGGKFMVGAATGAMGYLFNQMAAGGEAPTAPGGFGSLGKGLSNGIRLIAARLNLALSMVGLRSDTPQSQYIFRVVSDQELSLTVEMQGLVPDPNNYGKGVWLNIEDARWFANVNINQSINRSIVQMQIGKETIGLGHPVSDAGHGFIHFRNEVLPVVNSDIIRHGGVRVRERYDAR
ncbi:RHS repeat-associated core domain-containing protein [Alcanivorax sp. 24]|uniref:RHS repeat domain-containing protein n=1 Tax=Alcanivorax sp. 24 TaxID=2545266 RepID=UPI001F0DE9BE|nr:RHS repeat-associated core domain-containing protein [Alcanivorax sp. 24]